MTSKYQTTDDVEAQYAGGQPPSPKGHRRPKWLIVIGSIIGGIVVVIGLALALSPSPAKAPAAAPAATAPAQPATTAPAPTPPAPTPTGPVMLAPGQPAVIGDNSGATEGTVTVKRIIVTTQPADPSFGSAPANGYYVIVKVKATADPSYTQGFDINALDFYALDAAGNQQQEGNGNAFDALTTSQESSDITATLGAGQSSTGWEAFDVASPHGTIVYAPNSDGQPLAEWNY